MSAAQLKKLEIKKITTGQCGFYETFEDYKNGKIIPFDKGECIEYTTSVGGNFIWYKNSAGKKDWERAWKIHGKHWGFIEPLGHVFRIDTLYLPDKDKSAFGGALINTGERKSWSMIIDSGKIMMYGQPEQIKDGKEVAVELHSIRFSKGINEKIRTISEVANPPAAQRAAKKVLAEWFREDDPELAAQYEKEKMGSFGNAMQVIMSYIRNYNKRVMAREQKDAKN
jgi:hypothetical protein